MGSREDTKACVAAAFPESVSLIERAYRENSSFRDLCRDYRKCAETLETWRQSEDASSSSRAREYAELLSELAEELETWLGDVAVSPAPLSEGGGK